jgi:lipopolysaccharide/colanic/teichoic acid biosynthesis glycosyltransferase
LRESLAPAPSFRAGASWAIRARAARLAKRLLDLAASVVALILLSPLMVTAAALIRLTTPGPALFRQTRVGRNQRSFVLYKFRTMHDGCSDSPHREYVSALLTDDNPSTGGERGCYKLENDARITPLGRLLRRASIDELPQLLNVIRGEMSLVGPRPALPWEAELIEPVYRQRFGVPPGLTGLWQVSGRNYLTMRQGLELDMEYVRRQSFAFDLWILLKTVPVVLSTHGAQ